MRAKCEAMKAVVVGLGSMGRRRIRLMQAMADAPEIVGVNRSAERRAQVEGEFGIKTFATLAEAIAEARPQVAFLCTAPASHGPAVMECIAAGLHETARGEIGVGTDPLKQRFHWRVAE